jgi:hypothetical protein
MEAIYSSVNIDGPLAATNFTPKLHTPLPGWVTQIFFVVLETGVGGPSLSPSLPPEGYVNSYPYAVFEYKVPLVDWDGEALTNAVGEVEGLMIAVSVGAVIAVGLAVWTVCGLEEWIYIFARKIADIAIISRAERYRVFVEFFIDGWRNLRLILWLNYRNN